MSGHLSWPRTLAERTGNCLVRCDCHGARVMTLAEMREHMAAAHPAVFEGLGHVPAGVPWSPVIVDGEAAGLSFGPFYAKRVRQAQGPGLHGTEK